MNLQPPSALLLGPTGTGKTSALVTAIPAGLELFALITEPGGADSLIDSCRRIDADINKLHWATLMPTSSGWEAMEDMVHKISTMDFEALSKLGRGIGKEHFRATGMRLLNTVKNFPCERTGKSYGDITQWNDDRLFAWDSLTGASIIAWKLVVGHKPTGSPADYGVSQNFLHDLLVKIQCDRKCFFAMTAHIEKEMDELRGVRRLTVSTIGQKLAPKIPPFFSEVIRATRAPFKWSTLDNEVDLKNRALPIGIDLEPDFKPIVDAYRARLKLAGDTQLSASPNLVGTVEVGNPAPVPLAPLGKPTSTQPNPSK